MSEMEGTDSNSDSNQRIKRRDIIIEVFLVTGPIIVFDVSEWYQIFITVIIFRNVIISSFSKPGRGIRGNNCIDKWDYSVSDNRASCTRLQLIRRKPGIMRKEDAHK